VHPALLLVLLIAVLVLVSWLRRAPPARRKRLTSNLLIAGGVAVLLFLVATGRLHWLFAIIGGLIPIAQRALAALRLYQRTQSARGPTPGQRSSVETQFLRMSLDHDSGEMDGEVRAGRYSGRRLSELGLEELLELREECRADDQQSVAVLEAYLERVHGEAWRARGGERAGERAQRGNGGMSPAEAYEILGLEPGADRQAVIEAHRRLIQKLHPDRGGSSYLAAKLNQAKEVLLEGPTSA